MTNVKQGDIIKKLRIERGISQEALAKGISTRTTLSSFERRNTELSSSALLKYLDKLNVKFDEFQFLLCDNLLSQKEKVINRFIEIINSNFNRKELEVYLTQLEDVYSKHKDNFYLMIIAQLKILKAAILEINELEKNEAIRLIKEYLFKVENWCHFELTIFNNVLFIFYSEEIVVQFENVISRMWLLQDKAHYNSLISTFLINGCFLGFERADANLASLFVRHLEIVSANSRFVEAKIYLLIFKGLLPSISNQTLDSVSIKKGLKILDILDEAKANSIREFIFQYLETQGYEVCLIL
ncbi:helix-turn-helix domain-containing protein [Bifidobacterium longum]|nr:helix-turn-helix domain-containing protein [Bifidobacterium longum]